MVSWDQQQTFSRKTMVLRQTMRAKFKKILYKGCCPSWFYMEGSRLGISAWNFGVVQKVASCNALRIRLLRNFNENCRIILQLVQQTSSGSIQSGSVCLSLSSSMLFTMSCEHVECWGFEEIHFLLPSQLYMEWMLKPQITV